MCEAHSGPLAVRQFVLNRFNCPKPLWHHFVLPYLRPKALFTTNYDELIENGWLAHSNALPVPPLSLITKPSNVPATIHTPLYKPHGTIQSAFAGVGNRGFVVTMFDYFTMIQYYKQMIVSFLGSYNQTCLIFIGYVFQDLDIGAVLYAMRNPEEKGGEGRDGRDVPWYAVFPRNDTNVRRMYDNKFGIRQINRRAVDFIAELDVNLDLIPAGRRFQDIPELQRQGLIA